ncbi:ferredoxin-dependent glutamate synthase [groundwater metagenome]
MSTHLPTIYYIKTAEYVSEKHDLDTIELKWGQGAKCIGGEIKVNTIERAIELKKRGYIVTPDPENSAIAAAYKDTAIKEFERHSRLGFVKKDGFMAEVDRLRDMGFKRVTLKMGAYSMIELAMGSPYFKAVCMGRALMIPGFVGKNIGKWIKENDLPKTVSEFGTRPQEIFVCYEDIWYSLCDERIQGNSRSYTG